MESLVPESVIQSVTEWKNAGQRVVFTSGVFDIVHIGHLRLLERASKLGDKLVVAINSDQSVKRKKGPKRPINPLERRLEFLEKIRVVSSVFSFDSPSEHPIEHIKLLEPHIVAKSGGEWNDSNFIFADVVAEYGGEAVMLEHIDGISTSDLISTIMERYGAD